MKFFIKIIKLFLFKRQWRKSNNHNFTTVARPFDINKVKVGRLSYGHLDILMWDEANSGVKIGHFVSVADQVLFITGGNHDYTYPMNYPLQSKFIDCKCESYSKGLIIIEDDVWIGTRSIILSGVTVGQGAVVAAGSVVTKSVPPYSIVAGNPAKLIKMRFERTVVEEFASLDFSLINKDCVKNNTEQFYNKNYSEFHDFIKALS